MAIQNTIQNFYNEWNAVLLVGGENGRYENYGAAKLELLNLLGKPVDVELSISSYECIFILAASSSGPWRRIIGVYGQSLRPLAARPRFQ